ncbi:MAG: two-component system response regulator [Deltaproteobacteria bacterium]|nr:two-component system response regulator [Deltaproteobacteria bacterium]
MRERPLILVIDDEAQNRRVLEAILVSQGYEVIAAERGEEGLEAARGTDPDIVLLDIMMPGLDGYDVLAALKEDDRTRHVPVVMVTALTQVEDRVRALDAGADDFMSKPVDKTEVRARIRSLLKVKAYNDHLRDYQKKLKAEVTERTNEVRLAFRKLEQASLETIVRLSRAAEYRDDDTGVHILRMSEYAAAVARHLGMSEEESRVILHAAPMHDIGKIGIPDMILLKPGKLTAEEWDVMRRHPVIGKQILEGSDFEIIQCGEIIAWTHHEKWDGSGYPRGLAGKEIPLVGRVAAIADVFDALTSKRPYKEPFPVERAHQIIREGRGTHFDPDVVDAFFEVQAQIRDVKERYQDEGESRLFPRHADARR